MLVISVVRLARRLKLVANVEKSTYYTQRVNS